MQQIFFAGEAPAWYIVCDFLCMDLDALGNIIKEEPDTIRSWFDHPEQFDDCEYFQVCDNSPAQNAKAKYEQLIAVAAHIQVLKEALGCEKKVFVMLNRKRYKLNKKSFAIIAKNGPNPMPSGNGFQEMLEKLQSWCDRKKIELPKTLTRV